MSQIRLILGGVRSGKSLYAEQLASQTMSSKIYIATAEVLDGEMAERIEIHKKRRGEDWKTIEEPVEIIKIINPPATGHQPPATILIDCLTLWLANLLHREIDIIQQVDLLVEALEATRAEVILVSAEAGLGIIPENALARKFLDYAGILHQRVAGVANEVVLVVAGIPMIIKSA